MRTVPHGAALAYSISSCEPREAELASTSSWYCGPRAAFFTWSKRCPHRRGPSSYSLLCGQTLCWPVAISPQFILFFIWLLCYPHWYPQYSLWYTTLTNSTAFDRKKKKQALHCTMIIHTFLHWLGVALLSRYVWCSKVHPCEVESNCQVKHANYIV